MRFFSSVVLYAATLAACAPPAAPARGADDGVLGVPTDSAFAAVQDRGAAVMGVDQFTSTHVFEDLPDGGRSSSGGRMPRIRQASL